MKVITKEYFNWNRTKELKIIPIGDVHLGAASCDEESLLRLVQHIKDNPDYRWIGMGDYCEFINRRDPRFDYSQLAPWIGMEDLGDIAGRQVARFKEIFEPIAGQCLTMLCGNHETQIAKYTENDVYGAMVTAIKQAAKLDEGDPMAMGYYGWLRMIFHRGKNGSKDGTRTVKINLHHGFVGGKLAGAKALNMQRWLWTHECDLSLMGHSHNTAVHPEAIERLDENGNLVIETRKGAFTGTFLGTVNEGGHSTYSEVKGYFPLPMDGVEVILRPGSHHQKDVVKLIA